MGKHLSRCRSDQSHRRFGAGTGGSRKGLWDPHPIINQPFRYQVFREHRDRCLVRQNPEQLSRFLSGTRCKARPGSGSRCSLCWNSNRSLNSWNIVRCEATSSPLYDRRNSTTGTQVTPTFGSLKRFWLRKQPRWDVVCSCTTNCLPPRLPDHDSSVRCQACPRRFSLIAIIRPSTFQTFCLHLNPTPSSCTSTRMKCFQYPSLRWDHPPPFSVQFVSFHHCSR